MTIESIKQEIEFLESMLWLTPNLNEQLHLLRRLLELRTEKIM